MKYDFEKAKRIIEENKESIKEANLGMHEDWFWTAETVFANGKYELDLKDETTIGGIDSSFWATPTLQLVFKDDTDKMIPCFKGEKTEDKPNYLLLGVLSGPVQEKITPLSEENEHEKA